MSNPVLIMLVGIPGSGKSYFANKLAQQDGCVIHSSDSLREELFGDVDHQTDNRELFRVLENRIIDDLRAGKTVIYDATNISRRRRAAFVHELKSGAGVLLSVPFWTCPWICASRGTTSGNATFPPK